MWKIKNHEDNGDKLFVKFSDEKGNIVSLNYTKRTDEGKWNAETPGFRFSINDKESMQLIFIDFINKITKISKVE